MYNLIDAMVGIVLFVIVIFVIYQIGKLLKVGLLKRIRKCFDDSVRWIVDKLDKHNESEYRQNRGRK